MASPFDRLMNTIRPHLPGALDDAIRQELFMACDEFFKLSDVWQEDLEFEAKNNSDHGEIMPFVGRIERLLAVYDEGTPIRGCTMTIPDISGVATVQLPRGVTGGNYLATVSLTVSDPVSRDAFPIVPGELVVRYTEDLMYGILSRMMAQPSKTYSNISMARLYLMKFRSGASRAKNAMNTGNTRESQAWVFPRSFIRRK